MSTQANTRDDAPERFESFEEFWPYYVLEHRKPETQAMHAVGTALGIAAAGAALATRRAWLIPVGLTAAYGMAWFSHFTVEKNRPATFTYPLWSFAADFKMFGKILNGEMSQEVARCEAMRRAHTDDAWRSSARDGDTIDMGP